MEEEQQKEEEEMKDVGMPPIVFKNTKRIKRYSYKRLNKETTNVTETCRSCAAGTFQLLLQISLFQFSIENLRQQNKTNELQSEIHWKSLILFLFST